MSIFGIIGLAAERIARRLAQWHAPMITGYLLAGMLTGPYILGILSKDVLHRIHFLDDFALGFIALAAGVELYLKELDSRKNAIKWHTLGQLIATFAITSYVVYRMADFIPFMRGLDGRHRLAIALFFGVIFVARSPSSAIAIISELRAKGPFVSTALGVTVVKDILVIILFSITLSLGLSLIHGIPLDWMLLVKIVAELVLSFAAGWLTGKLIQTVLSTGLPNRIKATLILGLAFGSFGALKWVEMQVHHHYGIELRLEALLVVLLGSFYVTNYTRYRLELQEIIEHNGDWIYAIFFTLTGASLSLDLLVEVWQLALLLFFVRIFSMMIGAVVGGLLARDKAKYIQYGWMPFVTQAGVGIGLATEIAEIFPDWGEAFYTLVIAVIVISQVVGPPLFKFAIIRTGEAHTKGPTHYVEGQQALIFGLEHHSIGLARRLRANHWDVKIITKKDASGGVTVDDIPVIYVKDFTEAHLKPLHPETADTAVLLLSDEENYRLAEYLYEKAGTDRIVVRLNDFRQSQKFEELGAYIVNPGLAMVSLLDHYVRAPLTTSLLLGKETGRDTLDIVVRDKRLDGVLLRDLRLPPDVIILAVKRGDEMVITHGYTKLHVGDHLTFVGSRESLEKVALMCSNFEMPVRKGGEA